MILVLWSELVGEVFPAAKLPDDQLQEVGLLGIAALLELGHESDQLAGAGLLLLLQRIYHRLNGLLLHCKVLRGHVGHEVLSHGRELADWVGSRCLLLLLAAAAARALLLPWLCRPLLCTRPASVLLLPWLLCAPRVVLFPP